MRGIIPWANALGETNLDADSFFGRFLGNDRWMPAFRAPWMEGTAGFAPQANMVETPTAYEMTAELPGLKPEEFKVEFKDGMLCVSGEKQEEQKADGKTFHRVERRYGKFERRFALPAAVKEEGITAEFRDGVLKVLVPKSEEVQSKTITIKT